MGVVGHADRACLRWHWPVIGMIRTYIHLAAHLVILYNVEQLSRVLSEFRDKDIETNL